MKTIKKVKRKLNKINEVENLLVKIIFKMFLKNCKLTYKKKSRPKKLTYTIK